MRVYKYKLDVDGNPSVYNVPLVQPLKILMQNGVPVLWCEVDENEDSIFLDYRNVAESAKREIIDILLDLEME